MQNNNLKRRENISLLILVTAFLVCFNPEYAFAGCMSGAAEAGIFNTIACKVTTTLFDIRKIVYIIGGFGLIAFTFAAIFNKISFKHLANIALSLFLLSMMTPFIEYFTQAEGGKLKYGDHLRPSFTEQDYSMTFGECKGDECPSSVLAAGNPTGTPGAGGIKVGDPFMPIKPGEINFASMAKGPDIAGLKLDPLNVKPEDTRTGWQKFKDTIKGIKEEGLKAYDTASTVISSAKTVYKAADMTRRGFKHAEGIGGIINAGVGGFDNLTTATGAITSASATIGRNYTNKEGEKTLGEKVDDFFGGVNKGANEGKEVTKDLGAINGTWEATKDLPNDIKNITK